MKIMRLVAPEFIIFTEKTDEIVLLVMGLRLLFRSCFLIDDCGIILFDCSFPRLFGPGTELKSFNSEF